MNKRAHVTHGRHASGALALLVFFVLAGPAFGQNAATSQHVKSQQPAEKAATQPTSQPVASIYKEVKIGTDADEVRKLLGKAEIDDKDGFFYDEHSEMVQIRLDENAKVRLIAVTYRSNSPNLPSLAEVFGDDGAEVKPDGSVYRLVRYPAAGYWIAYSKTGGDKPITTVTMQKLSPDAAN